MGGCSLEIIRRRRASCTSPPFGSGTEAIEAAILCHRPEITFAGKVVREIKDQGETDPWWNRHGVIYYYLNRSGFEQWCVLESIGEDLLTEVGIQRIKKLRRKFPEQKVSKPGHMEVHMVGSPIKRDKAARMSDAQWLRAIAKYETDDWRRDGRDFNDGGARQLAGELQHATKENPARFVPLMSRVPKRAHPDYVSCILWGLTEADEVDGTVLQDAIIEAHGRPGRPYGSEIARLFEKHPLLARDPACLDVLAWYVENGDASEDASTDSTNIEREIVSINDLIGRGKTLRVRGISGARGSAAEAMGAVLWQVPEIAEKAVEVIERRIDREPLVNVRCSLLRCLAPLFNDARLRCARLVERLVHSPSDRLEGGPQGPEACLAPLITHEGTRLFPYLLYWTPDIGGRLLWRLLDSGDDVMHMIGAWHVFRRSFEDLSYASEADCLIEEGVVCRRLAADVASRAITLEEYRERAERQLLRFFNDEDKLVRRQAGNVFREIKPDEFTRFSNLAEAYLASSAFEDDLFPFFHALDEATCSVHEWVIRAAEKLIAKLQGFGQSGGDRLTDFHQLKDLLKREYAASESAPELRERLLDVIDVML